MDIIEMARELGKQIQQDDRYIALRLATQSNDEDQHLQDMLIYYGASPVKTMSGCGLNSGRNSEKI